MVIQAEDVPSVHSALFSDREVRLHPSVASVHLHVLQGRTGITVSRFNIYRKEAVHTRYTSEGGFVPTVEELFRPFAMEVRTYKYMPWTFLVSVENRRQRLKQKSRRTLCT